MVALPHTAPVGRGEGSPSGCAGAATGMTAGVSLAGAMRIGMVTETYPPEVNGVALTVAQLVQGLADSGHALQLLRPHQGADDAARPVDGVETWRLPGLPIPRYPQLKLGLPCGGRLRAQWALASALTAAVAASRAARSLARTTRLTPSRPLRKNG